MLEKEAARRQEELEDWGEEGGRLGSARERGERGER
jgi:hypothetical protein